MWYHLQRPIQFGPRGRGRRARQRGPRVGLSQLSVSARPVRPYTPLVKSGARSFLHPFADALIWPFGALSGNPPTCQGIWGEAYRECLNPLWSASKSPDRPQ